MNRRDLAVAIVLSLIFTIALFYATLESPVLIDEFIISLEILLFDEAQICMK